MKRWLAAAPFVLISTIVVVVLVGANGRGWTSGTPVPDVRGNSPMRSDRGSIRPLLHAGFCVDFRYEAQATGFERDGHFEVVADSYVISGEIPKQGSHLPPGSTVTVIVGGSDSWRGAAQMDWDSVPVICPK